MIAKLTNFRHEKSLIYLSRLLQLRIEQKAGRVFQGWEEGDIYFAPTYKYITNSDTYAYQTSSPKEKRRTPAWLVNLINFHHINI